jgi:hypothetical protein
MVVGVTAATNVGLTLASPESVSTNDPSALRSSIVKLLCRAGIPLNPVAVDCGLATGIPVSSTRFTRVSTDKVIVADLVVSMYELSVIANVNGWEPLNPRQSSSAYSPAWWNRPPAEPLGP